VRSIKAGRLDSISVAVGHVYHQRYRDSSQWLETTRVTIFGDSDSTRVTLRKMVTDSTLFTFLTEWLDSTRVTIYDSTVESESFLQSRWWTNPVGLYTKKWSFFASVMLKIGANFLFWLSSRAMLPCKNQVSPTCTEVDLWLCVSLMGRQGTIYWHLIVV